MKNLTWCQVVIRTQSIVSSRIDVIVENAISSNVYLDIGSPSETPVKVCKSCIFCNFHLTSYNIFIPRLPWTMHPKKVLSQSNREGVKRLIKTNPIIECLYFLSKVFALKVDPPTSGFHQTALWRWRWTSLKTLRSKSPRWPPTWATSR